MLDAAMNKKLVILLTAILFSILGWTSREILCHLSVKPAVVEPAPVNPDPPKPWYRRGE